MSVYPVVFYGDLPRGCRFRAQKTVPYRDLAFWFGSSPLIRESVRFSSVFFLCVGLENEKSGHRKGLYALGGSPLKSFANGYAGNKFPHKTQS